MCYWATPAPMDSQQDSKTHSASKGSHEDLFFLYTKHIYFFFCHRHLSIFSLSQHPLLCRWNRVGVTPSRVPFHLPPPCLLIPLQLKNQTALKQIDVLFNIVVTSSQGPHASALVTTAGLLSLAQRWLPLCWSLQ